MNITHLTPGTIYAKPYEIPDFTNIVSLSIYTDSNGNEKRFCYVYNHFGTAAFAKNTGNGIEILSDYMYYTEPSYFKDFRRYVIAYRKVYASSLTYKSHEETTVDVFDKEKDGDIVATVNIGELCEFEYSNVDILYNPNIYNDKYYISITETKGLSNIPTRNPNNIHIIDPATKQTIFQTSMLKPITYKDVKKDRFFMICLQGILDIDTMELIVQLEPSFNKDEYYIRQSRLSDLLCISNKSLYLKSYIKWVNGLPYIVNPPMEVFLTNDYKGFIVSTADKKHTSYMDIYGFITDKEQE